MNLKGICASAPTTALTMTCDPYVLHLMAFKSSPSSAFCFSQCHNSSSPGHICASPSARQLSGPWRRPRGSWGRKGRAGNVTENLPQTHGSKLLSAVSFHSFSEDAESLPAYRAPSSRSVYYGQQVARAQQAYLAARPERLGQGFGTARQERVYAVSHPPWPPHPLLRLM